MTLCDFEHADDWNEHCEKEAKFFYRIDYPMPPHLHSPQSTYVARCMFHGLSPSMENRWIIDENVYLISTIHES
jgi:hypothetical protein